MVDNQGSGSSDDYVNSLAAYVTSGAERELSRAYGLGRDRIGDGPTALVAAHGPALMRIVGESDLSREMLEGMLHRSTQFLIEAMAPFDMTVRSFEEATERLQHANDELIRADQVKDQFIAHMNHELRTPLNSVLGYCELLITQDRGMLSDVQAGYIAQVRDSGLRLLEMVNEILDMSKLRAGRLEISLGTVALPELISDVLAEVKPLASAKQLSLVAGELNAPRVTADPGRLRQVLLNLLSNAIKFTPRDGRVSVATLSLPGWIQIDVTDSGIGVPRDQQERIFEEFVQLDSAQPGAGQGTGLGLPLSRRLVELMGGELGLQSEPARGSTFFVRLRPEWPG